MGTGGKFEAKSLVGLTLDQFEVKSEIARGGMGVVYKGYQPSLDRWVAIKTLPIDLAGDRELVSRFQREAKAMAALNHNNIVQCIHSGESAGQYYIAMEYVEGPSVKDLLKSPTIETDKVFDILVQTCDGLEYAHKKGLVHRDIKPANLLYEEKTGCVKIADFGIAHFSKKDEDMLTLTADNVGMGTMNYMAPEQKINAKGVDHRADIYALGVIIYEAFTGKLPLGKFKLPSEVNAKLPRALDEVVIKCLSTEPVDRFGACSEVKQTLLDAKAATHDKSIRRTMRDALDRTLTAISPNRTVSVAVLGCAFLAFALVIVGLVGFALMKRGQGKTRDALIQQVATAKEAAEKAAGTNASGEAAIKLHDGEAAIKAADTASQAKDLDQQIAQLRKALEAYNASIDAVERDKQKADGDRKAVLAELAKKLDGAKAKVAALADDGFKVAGQKSLDDAKKALDGGDTDGFTKGLNAANEQVAWSITVDENVKALLASAAKLEGDKKAEADKAVAEVVELRKKGEFKPIEAAVESARKKLADLGQQTQITEVKKPPIDTPPVNPNNTNPTNTNPTNTNPTNTNPTNTNPTEDPELVRKARDADDAVAKVRRDVGEAIGFARKVDVPAGQAEAAAAETDYVAAAKKPVAERIVAFEDARKKFEGARDATLEGLKAALAAARTEAEPAAELAKEEWADAIGSIRGVESKLDASDKAKIYVEGILMFRVAARRAGEAAKSRAGQERAAAVAARESAVKRLGDAHSALAKGDELLKKADAETKPLAAVASFKEAAAAFTDADLGTPRKVVFTSTKKMIALERGADAIAGCAQGFVISRDRTLTLYSSTCEQISSRDQPDKIYALTGGEGDEVIVAHGKNGTLTRVIAGNPMRDGSALPGALGQPLGEAIWALAYHRQTKRLFAATSKRVAVYSLADGSPLPEITIINANLAPPMSLAVVRDGSLALTGLRNPASPENEWTFEARRYKLDDKRWTPLGDAILNEVAAVAAAGNTVIATSHKKEGGILLTLPGAGSLRSVPLELPIESASKPVLTAPTVALRIATWGRNVFLLDLPFDETPIKGLAPTRKRVKIYELKDE